MSNPHPSLIGIPRELRLIVYDYLLLEKHYRVPLNPPSFSIAWTQACRLIYAETQWLKFQKIRFSFATTEHLVYFLSSLSPAQLGNLRDITVHGYPVYMSLSMLKWCTLTEIPFQPLFELFPGLKLNRLTVFDPFHSVNTLNQCYRVFLKEKDIYFHVQHLIERGQGWKELRYVIPCTSPFSWRPTDRSLMQREPQPESWDKLIKQRDGVTSNASVEILLVPPPSERASQEVTKPQIEIETENLDEKSLEGDGQGDGKSDAEASNEDLSNESENPADSTTGNAADSVSGDAVGTKASLEQNGHPESPPAPSSPNQPLDKKADLYKLQRVVFNSDLWSTTIWYNVKRYPTKGRRRSSIYPLEGFSWDNVDEEEPWRLDGRVKLTQSGIQGGYLQVAQERRDALAEDVYGRILMTRDETAVPNARQAVVVVAKRGKDVNVTIDDEEHMFPKIKGLKGRLYRDWRLFKLARGLVSGHGDIHERTVSYIESFSPRLEGPSASQP